MVMVGGRQPTNIRLRRATATPTDGAPAWITLAATVATVTVIGRADLAPQRPAELNPPPHGRHWAGCSRASLQAMAAAALLSDTYRTRTRRELLSKGRTQRSSQDSLENRESQTYAHRRRGTIRQRPLFRHVQ